LAVEGIAYGKARGHQPASLAAGIPSALDLPGIVEQAREALDGLSYPVPVEIAPLGAAPSPLWGLPAPG
jgi:hypothetical protein